MCYLFMEQEECAEFFVFLLFLGGGFPEVKPTKGKRMCKRMKFHCLIVGPVYAYQCGYIILRLNSSQIRATLSSAGWGGCRGAALIS